MTGSTKSTFLHGKISPKDWQVASPLVMQGFSNFLGLFQVIMANPDDTSGKRLHAYFQHHQVLFPK